MIRIDIDETSARQFVGAIERYRRQRGISADAAVTRTAGSLAIILYQKAAEAAPKHLRQKLLQGPVRIRGNRKSRKAEINARVAAVRYTASGWSWAVLRLNGKPAHGHRGRSGSGSVKIELGGTDPSITLINSTPGASTAESMHPYLAAAIEAKTQDLLQFVLRDLEKDTKRASAA
ncbi:MAG: hypothetical protein JO317_06480 [Verrucomicrobiae bacterium]|nr:hypothetical protein [Verrucomicrobiae bacterium]